MSRKDKISYQFGPGKYFVGDICYALDDDVYSNIWGKTYGFEDGFFRAKNATFVVAPTAYGDGSYVGSDGVEYSVDAGVIGVVPESLWKNKIPTGGKVVVATTGISFSACNGQFTITVDDKTITIDTAE